MEKKESRRKDMKKSKKKFIMFAILSVLLMANMKNVNAGQVQKNDKSVAIEELGGYLSGVDCQKNDKVEISQSFNVENSKNKSSIFFVKVADEEIGAINVTEYEGKKLTSFLYSENFFNDIGEERISVESNGNGLSLHSKKETKVVTGENAGKTIRKNNSDRKLKKRKFSDISKNVKLNSDEYEIETASINDSEYTTDFSYIGTHKKKYETIKNTKNTLMLYTTKLDLIANGEINNQGICWAATGASIINYKRGGTVKCNARKVYYDLKKKYNADPVGNIQREKRMWEYYAISMKYVEHKLSFTDVLYLMESHKPVFCSFLHNEENSAKNYAHAVALCGCYYRTDLQRYYYVYMDPNMPMNGENVYVVNHIFPSELNGNTGYKFYYNPGNGDIYNNWRYAFY